MTLSLKLNGTTTASIPGSPSNGDTITMDNGVLRLSFSYGDHIGTLWCLDKMEIWDGAAWQLVFYGRDRIRIAVSGEQTGTGTLAIVTNTASALTLRLGSAISAGGKNYTIQIEFTMRSTHDLIEMLEKMSADADVTNTVELFGPGYMSGGKTGDVLKTFQYAEAPGSNDLSVQRMVKENKYRTARVYGKPNGSGTIANNFQRGYGWGAAFLRSTNVLFQFGYDPSSVQDLIENQGGYTIVAWGHGNGTDWWKTIDSKYQSNHDSNHFFQQPGLGKVNMVSATVYSVKSWLNAQILTDQKDSTIVRKHNEFMLTLAGKITTQRPFTLAALAAQVELTLASTYTTAFNNNYGFFIHISDSTQNNSFANALGVAAALRLYKYTGVADYLTEATRIKNILINQFQIITAGVNRGAFRKIHAGSGVFKCQEGAHSSNTDQPHIAMYVHAECCAALLDYYRMTGDATVRDRLDMAADYLITSQNAYGYWLVEQNNVNTYANANRNTGYAVAGSATVALGAFLIEWGLIRSGATNAATWKKQGAKALNYWAEFEPNPHGCYEFGEGYVALSSHALRMIIGGFCKGFKLTGNTRYQERAMYFIEMAIAQTKKIDVVFNASQSNNQDIHTGGCICTLDWNGTVGPEALSIMMTIATEGLRHHTDVKKHLFFYLYAMRCHALYGMKDQATYMSVSPYGYSFISPGTSYASAGGLDNTRMTFHAPSAALFLAAHYYLAATDNEDVYVTCLDADTIEENADRRVIYAYNPQASTKTGTITVKNLQNPNDATVVCDVEGVIGTPVVSGQNLQIPFSLTTDQIAKIVLR